MAAYTHPNVITFAYPYDLDLDNSTPNVSAAHITIKAPEVGNTNRIGRHQVVQKMRNGSTIVIDKGIDTDNYEMLQFKEVPDFERTRLVNFLTLVKWGSNLIKIVDHNDQTKICRVISTSLEAQELLKDTHADGTETLKWDFTLQILDVTNNPVELETGGIGEVDMSMLAIHLADMNHPHNPKTVTQMPFSNIVYTLDTVDAQLEKVNVIVWLVHVSTPTRSQYYEVKILTNADNTGSVGGEITEARVETMKLEGFGEDIPITFDYFVGYKPSDGSQQIMLKASVTINDVYVKVRRIKL